MFLKFCPLNSTACSKTVANIPMVENMAIEKLWSTGVFQDSGAGAGARLGNF